MMVVRCTTGLLAVALMMAPIPTLAVENVGSACLEQVYGRMAHEERLYRSVLFGQDDAKDIRAGGVLYDKEFDTWIKISDNEWRSLSRGNEGLAWSNALMAEQSDIPPRRGIFEIRQAPTSDLLPPLLQSLRALQCRLRSVCKAAIAQSSDDAKTLRVQSDGCLEFEFPVFRACGVPDITELGINNCDASVDAIMEREIKLLHMVVAYDAAYRSLMQFSGTFEYFLSDFRFPLLEPLWQMVRTLGALDNLPCFLGQCDE